MLTKIGPEVTWFEFRNLKDVPTLSKKSSPWTYSRVRCVWTTHCALIDRCSDACLLSSTLNASLCTVNHHQTCALHVCTHVQTLNTDMMPTHPTPSHGVTRTHAHAHTQTHTSFLSPLYPSLRNNNLDEAAESTLRAAGSKLADLRL